MIRSIQLGYSYTLTLILALPAAAFMVRLFILFHDCVHGSFFRPQGVNTIDFAQFMRILESAVKCHTNFSTYKINHGMA
jgi:omega-6 fatty acid desaturase (delta-12 desaturase)